MCKNISLLLSALIAVQLNLTAQEEVPRNYNVEGIQKVNSSVYQLVLNPTNNHIYVAGPKGFSKENEHFVYVLDSKTLTVKDSISVGNYMPFGIALNVTTQTLYVGHSLQSAVSAIDLKTKKQTLISNGDKDSKLREIVVDEKRNLVFVSDHGAHGVWVIDGKAKKYLHSFYYPEGYILGLNVDEEKGLVYTTDGQIMEGNVLVYNIASKQLEGKFKTWSYCPMNIALDKKGKRIFVSQSSDNNVTILNSVSGEIINKVYLGFEASPIGLVFDEKTNQIYTANRNKKEVAIVDADSYKVIERVPLRGLPNTIVQDTAGNIFVTLKKGKSGDEDADSVVKIVKK